MFCVQKIAHEVTQLQTIVITYSECRTRLCERTALLWKTVSIVSNEEVLCLCRDFIWVKLQWPQQYNNYKEFYNTDLKQWIICEYKEYISAMGRFLWVLCILIKFRTSMICTVLCVFSGKSRCTQTLGHYKRHNTFSIVYWLSSWVW